MKISKMQIRVHGLLTVPWKLSSLTVPGPGPPSLTLPFSQETLKKPLGLAPPCSCLAPHPLPGLSQNPSYCLALHLSCPEPLAGEGQAFPSPIPRDLCTSHRSWKHY